MKQITLLFFLLSCFSYSQSIEGLVLDKENEQPIEGVHITSAALLKNTYTNEQGKYMLHLKSNFSNRDTLYFSAIGYSTTSITIANLRTNDNKVILTPNSETLNEVNIISAKNLKPKIDYRKLAAMEIPVHSFASIMTDNKIYVIAGNRSIEQDEMKKEIVNRIDPSLEDIIKASQRNFNWENFSNAIQIYDITQDKWESSGLEVRKRDLHNVNLIGNRLFISGGRNLSKNRRFEYLDAKIEVIDLQNDNILIDHTNPHQALGAASFNYKGDLLILGGSIKKNKIGTKIFSDKIHLYKSETGLWYEVGKMPNPKETRGVLIDDKIYLVGGFINAPLKEIESFDLITGAWRKEAQLFRASKDPAVTHHDNILYIYDYGKITTYHTGTGELKEYRIGLNLQGATMYYANNKLYLVGGYRENEYLKKPSSECYSIDLSEFHLTEVFRSEIF